MNNTNTIEWYYLATGKINISVGPVFAEDGRLYTIIDVDTAPVKEGAGVLSVSDAK